MGGRMQDIVGRVFGRLEVTAFVPGDYIYNHHRLWLCRCECGVEEAIPYRHLRDGMVSECVVCREASGRGEGAEEANLARRSREDAVALRAKLKEELDGTMELAHDPLRRKGHLFNALLLFLGATDATPWGRLVSVLDSMDERVVREYEQRGGK